MESFQVRSKSESTVRECAESVMTTVPVVMRAYRADMRSLRPQGLSVPQFRVLIYLDLHAGASVSDVAEHLGLALSTTSQLIDRLLKRRLVRRAIAADDRRRATLTLTDHGATILAAARGGARARMEERVSVLSQSERRVVRKAMRALFAAFQKTREQ